MKDFKEDTLPLSWAPKYPLGAEILAVGAVCSSPEQDYPWQSWSCVQQEDPEELHWTNLLFTPGWPG